MKTSAARFCEHFSTITDNLDDADVTNHVRVTLVRYIQKHYFELVSTSEWVTIYEAGPEQPADSDSEADEEEEHKWMGCSCTTSEECHHEGGVTWGIWNSQLTTQTNMSGFDTIMAVTQHNLNQNLRAMHAKAQQRCALPGGRNGPELETCLSEWTYKLATENSEEVIFHASFDTPKIQLVSVEDSEKAIFYVSVRNGYLLPLDKERSVPPGFVCHYSRIGSDH
jgi:hypothetical protein